MEAFDLSTPGVFAAARADPDDTEDTGGMRCEIKTYEARYSSNDQRIPLQAGIKRVQKPLKERDNDSSLILTKYYTRGKELDYTELQVKSPHMRTALRTVIKEYPGMTFDTGKIIIRDEPKCLFHYRNEIREYGMDLDQVAVEHLIFLLNYMYRALESEISHYYMFMESPTIAPGIGWENLWMAFRPNDLIYSKKDNLERVVRLKRTSMEIDYWGLTVEEIQYNGTDYGRHRITLRIWRYDGYKPLTHLNAYPLQYHDDKDTVTNSLISRGKKFISLRNVHHRYYEGLADSLSPFRIESLMGEEDEFAIQSIMVKSRVIIDCPKFSRVRPTHIVDLLISKLIKTTPGSEPQLPDEDLLICSGTIPGFSLMNKRWCFFRVSAIEEFEYNTMAFKSLLLAAPQKKMIHSMIKIHKDERLQFDDLIKGKGKGMIFLLHGEPGVGKTLTAESVADYTQRPLYTVTSGDLGENAAAVERALFDALELATGWNAIVLIDEADVFLEQRSSHDLQRNSLVSVFLRLLEYYEGIMILTTNRIGVFDAAFKSRIHLAIKYPALPFSSRRDLWTTFLTHEHQTSLPQWCDGAFLDGLARERLNGRQIKNIVRTAHALAIAEGNELRPEDINISLKSIKDFESDFKDGGAEVGTEIGTNDSPSDLERREKRRRQE